MLNLRLFTPFALVAMLCIACEQELAVTKGEVHKLVRSHLFYFATEDGKVININPDSDLGRLIISNPSWLSPKGLIFENPKLELEPEGIRRSEYVTRGGQRYRREWVIPGLRIYATASIRVSDSTALGKTKLAVKLPGLTKVTPVFGVHPRLESGNFVKPDTLILKDLNVVSSAWFRNADRWIIGFIIGFVLLILTGMAINGLYVYIKEGYGSLEGKENKKKRLLYLAIASVLIIFSIAYVIESSVKDVSPNQTLDLTKEYKFYFKAGTASYKKLPADIDLKKVIEKIDFITDTNIKANISDFKLSTTKINWEKRNLNYTADGYILTLTTTLNIPKNPKTGKYKLVAHFNNLYELGKYLNAEVTLISKRKLLRLIPWPDESTTLQNDGKVNLYTLRIHGFIGFKFIMQAIKLIGWITIIVVLGATTIFVAIKIFVWAMDHD